MQRQHKMWAHIVIVIVIILIIILIIIFIKHHGLSARRYPTPSPPKSSSTFSADPQLVKATAEKTSLKQVTSPLSRK